ncbi:hypothetical protein BGX26_003046 [Mortierella sp. AD094]|nr:hypothetical protein BGX26_003046 [Mortierella sp. AD094]
MPSIFDIPELASLIGPYLDRTDLYNCVLVSTAWRDNLTGSLWRTFTCNATPRFKYASQFIDKPAFIANSHRIRTIRSNDQAVITLALLHCTRLQHVHVSREHMSDFTSEYIRNHFVPAMERNKTIETLVFKSFPSSMTVAPVILKKILAPLLVLTHLHITFKEIIDEDTFLLLAEIATQLLQLFVTFFIGHGERPMAELKQTKLKHLELRSNLRLKERHYFLPLLRASPALETLVFPSFEEFRTTEIIEIISRNCPKLRDIDLERVSYGLEDNHFADFMDSCRPSGLRSFYIHRNMMLGPKSVAALCSYTTTLEKVGIPALGPNSVAVVLHLLRSCPNMRTIDAFTGRHPVEHLGRFTAKELLKEPWVCLGLEVLCIPIADVYSSDETEGLDGKYDYHAEFYSQIALLIKLQKLNVGFNCRDRISNKTSPLFSLKSGLEILATLKLLRVLDMFYIKIDVHREELEWMCENWPHLERVKHWKEECHSLWYRTEEELEEFRPPELSKKAKTVIGEKGIQRPDVGVDVYDGE